MLADSHIHSFFSQDSSSSLEDIATSVLSCGIEFFTLSDHYELWDGEGYTFDVKERCDFLVKKRETFPGLLIGVEVGEPQNVPDVLKEWLCFPFDLFLGAIHVTGDFFGPHSQASVSDEEVYWAYFREVLRMVEMVPIDAVAHFDFPRRYLSSYVLPWDIVERILKEVVERGIALEINTSLWRKGVSWSMPDITILQRYRELGGTRVIVGSDAHQAHEAGMGIERAFSLARELSLIPGFYREHRFVPL